MKIYTKTGDKGKTSLIGGKQLDKDDLRIEAYGTIDELNSFFGLIRDGNVVTHQQMLLDNIQTYLFTIGSHLAFDPDSTFPIPSLNRDAVVNLEQAIDLMQEQLPALTQFILPGGHTLVSYCHIARTICRRAERRVVSLSKMVYIPADILVFLNRLSDYLFVLARATANALGIKELLWEPRNR
jgi:cob(I)alamin adenosyltransferase